MSLSDRTTPTPQNPYKTSAKPLLGESGRIPGTRFPFLEGKMLPDSPPTIYIYTHTKHTQQSRGQTNRMKTRLLGKTPLIFVDSVVDPPQNAGVSGSGCSHRLTVQCTESLKTKQGPNFTESLKTKRSQIRPIKTVNGEIVFL